MGGKHDNLCGLVRVVLLFRPVTIRIAIQTECSSHQRDQRLTLGWLRNAIPQRAVVSVERSGDHVLTVISVCEIRSGAHSDLNRDHGGDDGKLILATVVKRPHVLADGGMQGLLRNSPRAKRAVRLSFLSKLFCPSAELSRPRLKWAQWR